MAFSGICRQCSGEDFYEKKHGNHLGVYCVTCDAWIMWIKQEKKSFSIPFDVDTKTISAIIHNNLSAEIIRELRRFL